jgi:hypothetical protein
LNSPRGNAEPRAELKLYAAVLFNMKKLKNWDTINEVFTGFATANKGKEFVRRP